MNVAGSAGARLRLVWQALIASAAMYWLASAEWAFAVVAGVSLLLTVMPCWRRMPRYLRDVFACLVGAHVCLGMWLGLYEGTPGFDKALHLLVPAVLTAIIAYELAVREPALRSSRYQPLLASMAFSMGVCIGALWELFEFAMDATGLFTAQHGLEDTMLDLLADTLGALIGVLFFVRLRLLAEILGMPVQWRGRRAIHFGISPWRRAVLERDFVSAPRPGRWQPWHRSVLPVARLRSSRWQPRR